MATLQDVPATTPLLTGHPELIDPTWAYWMRSLLIAIANGSGSGSDIIEVQVFS